jgi:DNA (cytosine-5)-methyltransferase 1
MISLADTEQARHWVKNGKFFPEPDPAMMPETPQDAILYALRFLKPAEIAGQLDVTPKTVNNWKNGIGAPKKPQLALLRKNLDGGGHGASDTGFTFIDLFAGIGGIRRGFEAWGGRCIWTSEWDKYAVQTYKANFPDEHEIWADITTADPQKDVPDHDVLLAGFPCQPFSLAGVSKKNSLGRVHGFLDLTQGTLFFDVARIIAAKRPKAFLLENVKNLLSHDGGKTFDTIKRVLKDELGYHIHYKVVNAASWVPQHRQRIFIAGFRENLPFGWDLLEIPDAKPTLGTILHTPDEEPEGHYTETFRSKTRVTDRYTHSDGLWEYLQNYAKKHAALGNGFGCSLVGPDDVARTLSARYYKDGSEILIDRGTGKNPRKLTPRECARLMGFDTRETPMDQRMKIPVSDTRAYKQFGNSVAVPAVTAVAKIMAANILGKTSPIAGALPDPAQIRFSLAG